MATLSPKSNTGNLASGRGGISSDEQPRYSQRDTLLTMSGVLMVMLLASLDQSIVSPALPRIAADLQGFDRYTWVTTAYMLTSTVVVPLYGKFSDMFGRKPIFLFGVVVFLIGSALSGLSQSMNQLIAFRALQGIGAGALMPIAIAIVGDLFTPRERGKWQGITGAVFGVSSILGPALGGWLTEALSWHWIFYVNLPVGIVAMLVLIFLMPSLRTSATGPISIDYLGAALLIAGTVPLLLGFTWAGSLYAWLSPQIIGLFFVAVVLIALFIFYEARLERQRKQPIISPSLFKNSIFAVSAIVTAIFGMALFGMINFIPLFAQGVVGVSVSASGFIMTPLMLTSVVGSVLSGQLVSRLGRYKWIAITGMAISLLGGLLLLPLGVDATTTQLAIAMVVMGLGMGFGMSLYSLIVQNALPHMIGEATSALTFFRSIGSTIGLAAMGSVLSLGYLPAFHNALPATTAQALGNKLATFDNPQLLLSPNAQEQMQQMFQPFGSQAGSMYNQVMEAMRVGLAVGVHTVFIVSLFMMAIALVALFFLKEIPLRGARSPQRKAAPERAESDMPALAIH